MRFDLVTKRHPGPTLRFGGDAAAAGMTIRRVDIADFAAAFEAVVSKFVGPTELERLIQTDGQLSTSDMNLDLAETLEVRVWSQGIAAARFFDDFETIEQRIVGGRHRKLQLLWPGGHGLLLDAILFRQEDPLPAKIATVYRVQVNEYNGKRSVWLMQDYCQPAADADGCRRKSWNLAGCTALISKGCRHLPPAWRSAC